MWSMCRLEKLPEMRQNERKGEFVRAEDGVRTGAGSRES